MKNNKIKPRIKTSKLQKNPLFIRFLNWEQDQHAIEEFLKKLKDSFEKTEDKDIISQKLEDIDASFLDSLSAFQKKFIKYIDEVAVTHDISEKFLLWLDNSFKYIKESVELYAKDEDRKITISDPSGRWFEAIICYNFIMTYNYFTSLIIKRCPVCFSFFCHKGKYARYCSDPCKEKGKKKK